MTSDIQFGDFTSFIEVLTPLYIYLGLSKYISNENSLNVNYWVSNRLENSDTIKMRDEIRIIAQQQHESRVQSIQKPLNNADILYNLKGVLYVSFLAIKSWFILKFTGSNYSTLNKIEKHFFYVKILSNDSSSGFLNTIDKLYLYFGLLFINYLSLNSFMAMKVNLIVLQLLNFVSILYVCLFLFNLYKIHFRNSISTIIVKIMKDHIMKLAIPLFFITTLLCICPHLFKGIECNNIFGLNIRVCNIIIAVYLPLVPLFFHILHISRAVDLTNYIAKYYNEKIVNPSGYFNVKPFDRNDIEEFKGGN